MTDIIIAVAIGFVIGYSVSINNLFVINKKKKHFKRMLKNLKPVIWEKELGHFKQLGLKEQYRTQYDHINDGLQKINAQLKGNVDVEKNQKAKKDAEKAIEILKKQIDDKDAQIKELALELEATLELREVVKGFVKYNT